MSQIGFLLLFLSVAGCASLQAMRREEVNFDYVDAAAARLAAEPFRPQTAPPAALRELSYSQYQRIKFRHEDEIWKSDGLPFTVGFKHLGYLFNDRVNIHEFTATHDQEVKYLPTFFDFGGLEFPRPLPADLDYAGLNLAIFDEGLQNYRQFATFLGASYFRAIGPGMHYGTSARGVTVNAGLGDPEEFPKFTRFWLGKPQGTDRQLRIYALLDGPSVTGAYEFILRSSGTTTMQVRARLHLRQDVQSLGIAPLTSMFWRGENRAPEHSDFRPEVHDADGLVLQGDGQPAFWRPLDLDAKTRLSYFELNHPTYFGLMQRDRDFASYQDLEAHYQDRPSVWIEPQTDWGEGRVRLVELPTHWEYDDNIVAFWEPAQLPRQGESLEFGYTIHWTTGTAPPAHPEWRVRSTRNGADTAYPGTHVFVLEFGRELPVPPAPGEAAPGPAPTIVAAVDGPSTLQDSRIAWNPHLQTWRVTLRVSSPPPHATAIELKCHLESSADGASETWAYQWTP
jgi:glucans biosynthesis protein